MCKILVSSHIHIYIYICTYTCAHAYAAHLCIYIYTYICICILVANCKSGLIYTYMNICLFHSFLNVCIQFTYVCIYIHTHLVYTRNPQEAERQPRRKRKVREAAIFTFTSEQPCRGLLWWWPFKVLMAGRRAVEALWSEYLSGAVLAYGTCFPDFVVQLVLKSLRSSVIAKLSWLLCG